MTRTSRGQNETNTAWEREARICVSYAARWDTAADGPVQRMDADAQASSPSPTRCWKWCWDPKCLSTRCQVPEEDTYGLVAGGPHLFSVLSILLSDTVGGLDLHKIRFKMGWIWLGSGRSAPVFYAVDHSNHAGSVSVRFGTKP
ncbi:hypothetical protein B0H14DRAFT_2574423 [Mycena olivaceomarginata]|nr:hypothetical protein B0H14DRAFT_2574423 [Mycena olivaceomarginata]